MSTNSRTMCLDGILGEEDPDPDLKFGKDPLTRFFDNSGGMYSLKRETLTYKPIYL